MRAESAVEPTKSENITVTWRRSARSSGCALGVLDVVRGCGPLALPPERYLVWQKLTLQVGAR